MKNILTRSVSLGLILLSCFNLHILIYNTQTRLISSCAMMLCYWRHKPTLVKETAIAICIYLKARIINYISITLLMHKGSALKCEEC